MRREANGMSNGEVEQGSEDVYTIRPRVVGSPGPLQLVVRDAGGRSGRSALQQDVLEVGDGHHASVALQASCSGMKSCFSPDPVSGTAWTPQAYSTDS